MIQVLFLCRVYYQMMKYYLMLMVLANGLRILMNSLHTQIFVVRKIFTPS